MLEEIRTIKIDQFINSLALKKISTT